ncbi:NEW3 domain-containing protein [Kutzneria sp. NPDC051319]|uniref:NEW3 domain-containing protein n=1 Tax=Kutzneria sp. NPDC051319 TaxID=3155047 RepID=UPI00341CF80D
MFRFQHARRLVHGLVAAVAVLPMITAVVVSDQATAAAEESGIGATPALGWSSWSFVRRHPTAATIKAQADAMRGSDLARVGYSYVNIDDFWYPCPGSQGPAVDAYGRWTIDTTEFPDAGGKNGIRAVADHVHADGLKFGLYVTPGISNQAVAANTPIEGTTYHAADIADPSFSEGNYNCGGMVGIDYSKPGAQAFLNSWANQFASWGVDYLKLDGVGIQDIPDVKGWSTALRQTGRPIHLELSNSLDINNAATWAEYANGWRTGGDIECYCGANAATYPLTTWGSVATRFDQAAAWQPYGRPGGFNDYDSIEVGNGADTGLTPDERRSQLSLWALAASPLILGTDLTHLDPADLALLKNTEVLAVDQDGIDATRVTSTATTQIFAKTAANGDVTVGIFNTGGKPAPISTTATALGLPAGSYLLHDLWTHQVTQTTGTISPTVPSHGVALYRLSKARGLAEPNTSIELTGLPTSAAGNQPVTATATFTNNGTLAVNDVDLSLRAQQGYTVKATSPTRFGSVRSGQTVHATFQIVPPTPHTTLFGTGDLTAAAHGRWLGVRPLTATTAYPLTVARPVPAPYQTFSAANGSFAELDGRLGIRDDGADVYGDTNQYSAVYRPGAELDGTVATVKVTAQQATDPWAKAGIMARDDVTAAGNSKGFLILAVTPGNGNVVQWDSDGDGQLDSSQGAGGASYPTWLKLVRTGASYRGYYSTDNANWTLIATVSPPGVAATQDVAVFSTAHSAGNTGEADFDGFTVTPPSP